MSDDQEVTEQELKDLLIGLGYSFPEIDGDDGNWYEVIDPEGKQVYGGWLEPDVEDLAYILEGSEGQG